MTNDFVETLASDILKSGLAARLEGCSDKELKEIESEFSVALPATYNAFMQKMGKGAGELWSSCAYKYPDVIDFCRDMADEFLQAHSDFRLSTSDFVFIEHQGCEFFYFDTKAGEDPPVYRFGDKETVPVKVVDHLSHFFEVEILKEIAIWRAYLQSESKLKA
jgi:hypothetical protein